MVEYIASFKDSVQISPDDFDVSHRMLHCDENTTLKEVMDWAQKIHKEIKQLTINQPEEIKEISEDMPF